MPALPRPDPTTTSAGNDLALRAALAGLDAQDARVLLPVYVDGLTLEQVADTGSEPLAAVRHRVGRAMVELGRALLDGRD